MSPTALICARCSASITCCRTLDRHCPPGGWQRQYKGPVIPDGEARAAPFLGSPSTGRLLGSQAKSKQTHQPNPVALGLCRLGTTYSLPLRRDHAAQGLSGHEQAPQLGEKRQRRLVQIFDQQFVAECAHSTQCTQAYHQCRGRNRATRGRNCRRQLATDKRSTTESAIPTRGSTRSQCTHAMHGPWACAALSQACIQAAMSF